MSIFDNLLARWGYTKTRPVENPTGWLLAEASGEKFNIPDGSLPANQADLMRRLSWVNIAVTTTARAAAVLPLNVLEMDGERNKDIPNHPFEQLLNMPNPLQSRYEFIEGTLSWRLLTGNCYWWLNRSSQEEEPAEMWIIPSNHIQPVPDENLYLKGYIYDSGQGGEFALDLWEVAHFKSFNPVNPFVGLSPIEALAIVAEGDLDMQTWNTELFGENNARLPGILAFADSIPDPDWEKIKRDTDVNAKKRQLMLLRNVRAGGVNWIQATATQREMEFLSGRKSNRQEIFDGFGPGLYAMLSENATEANARTAKATFTEFTLWPLLTSIAEKIANDILPAYGENLKAEFDDPRIVDRAMELQEMTTYALTHTIDEIREKYYEDDKLEKITKLDGDKRGYMLPAQISPNTPIEESEEPEPMVQPGQTLPGEQPVTDGMEQPGEEMGEDESGQNEQPIEENPELAAEMKRWERKALKALKAGKSPAVEFVSEIIQPFLFARMETELAECTTAEEVKALFQRATSKPAQGNEITALLEGIRLGVEALKV